MTESITGNTVTAPPTRIPEAAKGRQKAGAGARSAHVASRKAKRGKAPKVAKRAPRGSRDGSKTARVLELLKRAEGASMKELMKATNWQPHSVRGFLSGAVRKSMGLAVTSVKGYDGERRYSVKA